MKNLKGFTLIEVLIYIGLFGVLVGGAVTAAFSILESDGRTQVKALMQQEGDFVVAKINWTMSGAKNVNAPAVNATGSSLSVGKWDTSTGDPIVITFTDPNVTIARGAAAPEMLNSADVTVSSFVVRHEYLGGSNPESVTVSFTLHGRTPNGMPLTGDFTTTNYIRR